MKQITAAAVLDGDVTRAFKNVTSMLRHPATLADPELLAKAVATYLKASAEFPDRNAGPLGVLLLAALAGAARGAGSAPQWQEPAAAAAREYGSRSPTAN